MKRRWGLWLIASHWILFLVCISSGFNLPFQKDKIIGFKEITPISTLIHYYRCSDAFIRYLFSIKFHYQPWSTLQVLHHVINGQESPLRVTLNVFFVYFQAVNVNHFRSAFFSFECGCFDQKLPKSLRMVPAISRIVYFSVARCATKLNRPHDKYFTSLVFLS